jgi:hypothetical protein
MPNFFSHLRRKTLAVLILGVATLVAATAAIAGTVTATATVTGAGTLGLSHGATAAIGTVTIDGTDQSVAYTVPLSITDGRGNGAGWNATITSTSFSDGGGHTLPASASSISAVALACVAGGSCTNPTNAVTYARSPRRFRWAGRDPRGGVSIPCRFRVHPRPSPRLGSFHRLRWSAP